MSSEKPSTLELQRWYRKRVRPFLASEEAGRVEELDREIERLEARERIINKPISACFVGGSGIGKSTLINALVAGDEIVVPSGGVGPLTAQALQIGYGDTPAFAAIYHPPKRVWTLGFALETALRRLESIPTIPVEESVLASTLDEEELEDVQELKNADDSDLGSRMEYFRKQAQLLITGGQDSECELRYLVDGIREITGNKRVWGTVAREIDKERLAKLRVILNSEYKGDSSIHEVDSTSSNFRRDLHDHAAGFLAPVIQQLEVSWNSPLLKNGLELIDLPGLGIAGDVYRKVTEKWVKNDAHAVVLVVNHRGVMETDANLLRTSGFLTRLLHSIDDHSADPINLVVAVVKTDEIANERRVQDKSKSKAKREHLVDVMNECRQIVRSQIRDRLAQAWTLGNEELGEGKTETISRIVEGMQIYPVSAIEYRKLLIDDEEDKSFLRFPEESGVTALADGLGSMAVNHAMVRMNRFGEALQSFQNRLSGILLGIHARWEEGERAREEAESLRKDLDFFLKPLREEFKARQGSFRSFLKEALPSSIEKVVLEASIAASKTIRGYLRKLRDAHWKTLQAAVKREGTYVGARHINLPTDFAQAFEDPIAEAWSKTILKELRKRTREYSDDCLCFVDQVVNWAHEQVGRVQPKRIEAHRETIAADTKHLATIGKDVVDELRDNVKSKLSDAIEGPIRRRCKAFVAKNDHVGTGVRNRILELFDQLAEEAVDAAKAPAQRVLLENYTIVEKEIVGAWENHQDPLASAAEAIVSSHEDSVKRSDAQKRKSILDTIDAVLADQPTTA